MSIATEAGGGCPSLQEHQMRLLPSLDRALLALTAAGLLAAGAGAAAQPALPNPILFVTMVPHPSDSSTMAAAFGGHLADMWAAPRGGDLWIRYTDGTLRNLTQAAGYGVASGLQGANAIAVRDPAVYWDGTKAVFSMIVGGATSQHDHTKFTWQLYEITGLGQNETPTITKVPNQPAEFNNISPAYGTDDRIIFVSDRPRNAETHLYPQYDEYLQQPTNTGLWSLAPASGDLFQLDNSPSGDFNPFIDSYGRVIFTRWDHLQRDGVADNDALGQGNRGTFNYSDESAGGVPNFGVRTEIFPEPQGKRTDLLAGTNMTGFEFNIFTPWQINEDGSRAEIVNHLGRHELRAAMNRSITDDPNVVPFNFQASGRANRNPIVNFHEIKEAPGQPGTYYGVDAVQEGTHVGGQIVTITAGPTLDPNQTVVTYITDRSTSNFTPEGAQPPPSHSGFYRDPLPLSNGTVIAVHTPETHPDRNMGTRANPVSRYAFRLKSLRLAGNVWVADQNFTTGITKQLSYWDPDVMVNFSGTLWEMQPVELRARPRPERRRETLPQQEAQVMSEEGIDEAKFRHYLEERNLSVVVSRDVTHRDAADHQQPFFLRIAGTNKQSPGATGKIYDITSLQIFQGDLLRGMGMTSPGATPLPGRRVLAQRMHDSAALNPANPGGLPGSVRLGTDGSMAAFVPARRATTWQLADANGAAVVRERYWLTFKPGEIRVCASCHGTNDDATAPINPIPANKPAAFRDLLRSWKSMVLPSHPTLTAPANDTTGLPTSYTLTWAPGSGSPASYRLQISTSSAFDSLLLDNGGITARAWNVKSLADKTTYYWRVSARNEYGDGDWSPTWHFTTGAPTPPLPAALLRLPADDSSGVSIAGALVWYPVSGAKGYRVQIATEPGFTSLKLDTTTSSTESAFARLANKTRYYWRVQGMNDNGGGAWSATWSFTTASVPLTATALLLPANNAEGVPTSPTLRWSGVDGAIGYQVQLADNDAFTTTIADNAGIGGTSDALTGLANRATYYWRVRALDGAGTGPWSETWRFTTSEKEVDPPAPATTVLLSPSNDSTGVPGTYRLLWNDVAGATTYQAQIASGSDFASPLRDWSGLGTTSHEFTGLDAGSVYYWRVRASNAAGDGPWSEAWRFTTASAPTVGVPGEALAGASTLDGVYPDPFAGETMIGFTLARREHVTLTVVDVMGRAVATVLDDVLEAGAKGVTLDATGLPAGIYFCRMTTPGGTLTRMIHLVK
jgi:hypothetical protein